MPLFVFIFKPPGQFCSCSRNSANDPTDSQACYQLDRRQSNEGVTLSVCTCSSSQLQWGLCVVLHPVLQRRLHIGFGIKQQLRRSGRGGAQRGMMGGRKVDRSTVVRWACTVGRTTHHHLSKSGALRTEFFFFFKWKAVNVKPCRISSRLHHWQINFINLM